MPAPVKSLLNYPDVVKKMNDDLDWTGALGSAVTAQQKDVIDAIQAFRRNVYAVGNLKTDDKQIVVVEKETIKVVQANPQVIYVPQYQPAQVVVVQSAPVYAYYPTPYPVTTTRIRRAQRSRPASSSEWSPRTRSTGIVPRSTTT